jgi:hypothetical protein
MPKHCSTAYAGFEREAVARCYAASLGTARSINRKNRWLRAPATTLQRAALRQPTIGADSGPRF